MKAPFTALLGVVFLLIISIIDAWAGGLPEGVTPELIKTVTRKYLETPENYTQAIQLLDCGKELPDLEAPADVILFYGYATKDENDLNPTAVHRLKQTLSLYQKHLGKRIIVTGNGYPEKDVARKGAQYLKDGGVLESDIIMDDTSTTTWLNIDHGMRIFADKSATSTLFVSSPYHIDRILRYYEKMSKDASLPFHQHFANLKVYWTSYDHHKDDDQAEDKKNQVVHEIYAVISDHWRHGNPLRSKRCRQSDEKEGKFDTYTTFINRLMEKISKKATLPSKSTIKALGT